VESSKDKWVISASVRSTYSSDGAILLDVNKARSYNLNVVAAKVWATIEGDPCGMSFTEILDAMEIHFRVPRHRLTQDTSELLRQLKQFELVSHSINHVGDSTNRKNCYSAKGEILEQSKTRNFGSRKGTHHRASPTYL